MILSFSKQVAEIRLKAAGDWPVAQAEELCTVRHFVRHPSPETQSAMLDGMAVTEHRPGPRT